MAICLLLLSSAAVLLLHCEKALAGLIEVPITLHGENGGNYVKHFLFDTEEEPHNQVLSFCNENNVLPGFDELLLSAVEELIVKARKTTNVVEGEPVTASQIFSSHHKTSQLLKQRLSILRRMSSQPLSSCSDTKFLRMQSTKYGDFGNILIEFAHASWLANQWNSTLIIPPWMKIALEPFDFGSLQKSFCVIDDKAFTDQSQQNIDWVVEIFPIHAFWLRSQLSDFPDSFIVPTNASHLKIPVPLYNEAVVTSVSQHFVHVYSSLWGNINPSVVAAASWLIDEYLGKNFR